MLAVSARPRPAGPASGAAVRSSQDQVSDQGRLSTHAPASGDEPEASVIIHAVRHPAPTSRVVTPRTTTTTSSTGSRAGAIATAIAVTISSSAVRRTRSRAVQRE